MKNGNGHKPLNGCQCGHVNLGRMREILNHVFLCKQLPSQVSRREKSLILGKLVHKFTHGNGFNCPTYGLTGRGEEVLIELYERRCR
jgi:hypothetical protein